MATIHPVRRLQALVPLYAERFSCIGSECEDTCCAGWRVTIDKKTFKTYKQLENHKLTALLDSKVKRVRSQASDSNFGRMELNPQTDHVVQHEVALYHHLEGHSLTDGLE